MTLEAPTTGAGGVLALFPDQKAADDRDQEDVLGSQDVVADLWAF